MSPVVENEQTHSPGMGGHSGVALEFVTIPHALRKTDPLSPMPFDTGGI